VKIHLEKTRSAPSATVFMAGFLFLLAASVLSAGCMSEQAQAGKVNCSALPIRSALETALNDVVDAGGNGGFPLEMWLTTVNRDGEVCEVLFSGNDRGDQWPGSRVISAQKANTANAFSLPGLALSTANLFSAVQPGNSLYGLQHSNPVDTTVAYGGASANNGQPNDPMVGKKIGGVNVFGGGLPLYDSGGTLVGALGVSGNTSCTDHIIAWKVRDAVKFDTLPGGVSPTKDDNIVFDTSVDMETGHTTSAGGWGHRECDETATKVANDLPNTHPVHKAEQDQ
jgi:uncharacterized protein GlcG (DUF336 family)